MLNREEIPEDFPACHRLVETAFKTAKAKEPVAGARSGGTIDMKTV